MEKRLQKILSEAGISSRRKAEEMIAEGRVTVNGRVAEIGQKADPMVDHVKVDGKLLTGRPAKLLYLAFHKPIHVVSTLSDPEERPTIKDYVGRMKTRVYPVGRLDFDSEGLLLLTNDGDFANGILHPSKKIPKVYKVKVKGVVEDRDIERLEAGVKLEDGKTAPAKIRKMKKLKNNSWLEITLHEGKKRQIRRMLQSVGHPVIKLIRIRVGSVSLGALQPGEMRELSEAEIASMKENMQGRA